MMCYPCLNDGQSAGRINMTPAITVFNGQAMCLAHLNTTRGLPENWGCHPAASPQPPVTLPPQSPPTRSVRPVRSAAAHAVAASATEPDEDGPEVHEECLECGNYANTHYQPEIEHCSCGAAWVDGQCDTQMDEGDLERLLHDR